ncbi:MAG: endonuclease Q family protein, partial [Oscillospiraceae bacterium]|nr:endonuclease Q family protein [Oscillospiraceae bacterium]
LGKYHFDGHRACGVFLSPAESARLSGICPACGGRLTAGVQARVEEMADRDAGHPRPTGQAHYKAVPLMDLLAASMGHSSAGKREAETYRRMVAGLGPELRILLESPIEEIMLHAGKCVADAVEAMREGTLPVSPGGDGAYGKARPPGAPAGPARKR